MSTFDTDQQKMADDIRKGAMTLGIIVGVIAALIAYFALGGFGMAVRWAGTAAIGAGVGYGLFRWRNSAASDAAKCEKCGAPFSISRTDRKEEVVGSENKSETKTLDDGSIEQTVWVEDTVDVEDTYTCAKCGDVNVKAYQTHRRRDEEVKVKPARAPARATAGLVDDVTPPPQAPAPQASARRASKPGRADSSND